jgi:hypothetical protein
MSPDRCIAISEQGMNRDCLGGLFPNEKFEKKTCFLCFFVIIKWIFASAAGYETLMGSEQQ